MRALPHAWVDVSATDERNRSPELAFQKLDALADRLFGRKPSREIAMLGWALVFAILAVVAGGLGFFALAGLAASIAKILLLVFVVLLVASFVMGRRGGRSIV